MASSTSPAAKSSRQIISAASVALLGVIWAAAAWVTADRTLLPYPSEVAGIFWAELSAGEIWFHLSATLLRVIAAFVLAMSIGCVLGIFAGRKPAFNAWADPWIIIFLNLPALVTIVLCYLWIGLNEVAAIIAVAANKIPMITVMMREGARALNPALADMAQAFQMPRFQAWRHVIVPQLAPHFAASARSGLALIWKIVLVVEFLGRSNGIGFQIHLYFQLFEVGHILAYAFSFIGVMLLVEYLLVQPWEKSASKWRLNES
jgi:NitT/TauT family transport system permease protein